MLLVALVIVAATGRLILDHALARPMMFRELRAVLCGASFDEVQAYPPNLQELARSITGGGGGCSTVREWRHLFYVANLRTNDPARIPIVMVDPNSPGMFHGMILRNGTIVYYADTEEEQVQRLLNAPWLFAMDELEDQRALEELRQRIRVIKPETRR